MRGLHEVSVILPMQWGVCAWFRSELPALGADWIGKTGTKSNRIPRSNQGVAAYNERSGPGWPLQNTNKWLAFQLHSMVYSGVFRAKTLTLSAHGNHRHKCQRG
jgi:hypothetical protein